MYGRGGGGGASPGTQVNPNKLFDCVLNLYSVFTDSFTSTVPSDPDGNGGSNGSFAGTMLGPGRNQATSFAVVNDSHTTTWEQATEDANTMGFPGQVVPGHMEPANPYITFTVRGIADSLAVSVQIIELGNALNIISGKMTPEQLVASDRTPGVPGSGFLNNVAGIELLNCLKGKDGIK